MARAMGQSVLQLQIATYNSYTYVYSLCICMYNALNVFKVFETRVFIEGLDWDCVFSYFCFICVLHNCLKLVYICVTIITITNNHNRRMSVLDVQSHSNVKYLLAWKNAFFIWSIWSVKTFLTKIYFCTYQKASILCFINCMLVCWMLKFSLFHISIEIKVIGLKWR